MHPKSQMLLGCITVLLSAGFCYKPRRQIKVFIFFLRAMYLLSGTLLPDKVEQHEQGN